MILLLGNNECIRHDILLSLFIKKYIVSEQRIDDSDYYTKPFMTVYINPTTAQIQKIKQEDTVCVVAKNNPSIKIPNWMRIIPYDNTTAKCISEIYEENCPFGKGREVFGIACLEGKEFTLGGAYVHLTPRQMKAVKLLIYNSNKEFPLYDVSSYLEFHGDSEVCFVQMVEEINAQCKRLGREKLILCKNNKYYISPSVVNY